MHLFFVWFKRYIAEVIKTTMLRPVRESAGLGNPPMEYCIESINSTLKQFVNFKKSDWPVFNDNIKKFVETQQKEVQKAIVGIGQYVLKDEFQHFKVSSSTWFSLSECQRKVHIDKFDHASVDNKSCCTADTFLELTDPQLSVDIVTASTLTGLPVLVLKNF